MEEIKNKLAAISQFILQSDLASDVPEYEMKYLDAFSEKRLDREDIAIRFEKDLGERMTAKADLYVNFRYGKRSYDEKGNKYVEGAYDATVNWPSFGSMPADVAIARTTFMAKVAKLAKDIDFHFGESFTLLVATKAEQEEQAEKSKRAQFLSQIRSALARSKARPSGKKHELAGLPEGEMFPIDEEVTIHSVRQSGQKTFHVWSDGQKVEFQRLS